MDFRGFTPNLISEVTIETNFFSPNNSHKNPQNKNIAGNDTVIERSMIFGEILRKKFEKIFLCNGQNIDTTLIKATERLWKHVYSRMYSETGVQLIFDDKMALETSLKIWDSDSTILPKEQFNTLLSNRYNPESLKTGSIDDFGFYNNEKIYLKKFENFDHLQIGPFPSFKDTLNDLDIPKHVQEAI